jgi:carboxylate-amine ligase
LALGVEEEFLLVDRDGRLAAGNPEITDGADEHDGHIDLEFLRCQIESATTVCEDVDDIVTGLRDLRDHLAIQAAAGRLVPR